MLEQEKAKSLQNPNPYNVTWQQSQAEDGKQGRKKNQSKQPNLAAKKQTELRDDGRKRKATLDVCYTFPASKQAAEAHKEIYRLALDRFKENQGSKCPCCQKYAVKKDYPLCCPPLQLALPTENKKTAQIYIYFTFLKGLIIFLALRFLFYDLITLYRSVYGSYCSQIFRSKRGVCTYTLSGYNLKGQTNADSSFDTINAVFSFLSIVFFAGLKHVIQTGKKRFQANVLEEEKFSLLVSQIPTFIIQREQIQRDSKKEKQWKIKNSRKDCETSIKRQFDQRIIQYIEKGRKKQEQFYFLQENTNNNLISRIAREKEKQFKQVFNKKDQDINICTAIKFPFVSKITLCYDLSGINIINNITNDVQFQLFQRLKDKEYQRQERNQNQNQTGLLIKEYISYCTDIGLEIKKQLQKYEEKKFHSSHFIGKAIVSFEYQFFRDIILKAYEEDPKSFKINEKPIVIEPAPKPTDIYWQNLNETQSNRKKFNEHSWIVMGMMLVLSFAAFVGLQLFVKKFEMIKGEETPWETFQRRVINLVSSLISALINKFLAYETDVLVKMQKHSRKNDSQKSVIIKSILAQSFNSLFIYIIIYAIHPQNPLGAYSLAEKAISLAIVSNLLTLFFQVVRLETIWKNMKRINLFASKQEQQFTKKFQIELNKQYEYPKFDQEGMYVSYTLMVFLVSFYGYLVPVITPIVFISFIVLYWVDKYNAFRRSSLDSFDDSRGDFILAIVQLSVLLSAVSYFMWDLSIQKEPKVKPLNLACILLALQFVGFQILVSSQIKTRIVTKQEKKQQKFCYQQAYSGFQDRYEQQNPATMYVENQDQKSKQNQKVRIRKGKIAAKKQTIEKLITEVSKFESHFHQQTKQEQGKPQQKDNTLVQGPQSPPCPRCNKPMSDGVINNIFCDHSVCVVCFWNSIYYQIETMSQISCVFCQQTIDQTLYFPQLQGKLKQKVRLIKNEIVKKSKKRICTNCYDASSQTFNLCDEDTTQCTKCNHHYCKQCHFESHQPKTCKSAFQQRAQWKKCSDCSLKIQPTKICYTHLPGVRLQTKCPVCILGWSDNYNHSCKNQKAEASCWFISVLKGIAFTVGLFLGIPILFLSYLVFYSTLIPLLLAYFPIEIISISISDLRRCSFGFIIIWIFLPIMPIPYLLHYVRVLSDRFQQNQYIRSLKRNILELPLQIKDLFYEYQPYKQVMDNYTQIQIHSKTRRICYFLLMLLLLPILFPLAALFFVASALVVFSITLVLLPFFCSKQKGVSLWIPIVFYPVMLIYYFAPIYFGDFVWPQLKDLVLFYIIYTKTMFCYLLESCTSNNNESTSVYEGGQDQSFF